MKYKLIKIPRFSGNKATVYSVIIDDNQLSQYELFISENKILHESELANIAGRLRGIGVITGARYDFFIHNEGVPGDGVVAFYDDPDKFLRLYCIRFGTQIVILGGGGEKEKNVHAFQEVEKLKDENYLLRDLSKLITSKLRDEIDFSPDGLEFIGNLELEDDIYD